MLGKGTDPEAGHISCGGWQEHNSRLAGMGARWGSAAVSVLHSEMLFVLHSEMVFSVPKAEAVSLICGFMGWGEWWVWGTDGEGTGKCSGLKE